MYTKEDSELTIVGVGIVVCMIILAIILMATKSTSVDIEKKAQKEAIAHGAAHYVVDTNGVVSFEWNK